MLYQRYGNPMDLLQQMLDIGQLTAFLQDLIQTVNEERNEKATWELYLHSGISMHGITFEQFRGKAEEQPKTADMNEVETTVKNSMKILENFQL